ASSDDACSADAVAAEPGGRLRHGVSAAVVQRLDLDVERAEVAVPILVLDARIGELHVPILLGQIVLDRPAMNLLMGAIRPAVAVRLAAIAFLQELLVLALQLVVEDDTADEYAVLSQAF